MAYPDTQLSIRMGRGGVLSPSSELGVFPCLILRIWDICHTFNLKFDPKLNVEHLCDWFAILSCHELIECVAC